MIDLELYAAIDTNASSWAFGSVGTVRFVLKKAIEKRWERLTASNESVKNHRVWWEKQEQVQKEDDKKKKAKEEAESRVRPPPATSCSRPRMRFAAASPSPQL